MSEPTGAEDAPPALNAAQDALFLDFDGCLVEIAPRPDAIIIPKELGKTLTRLSERLGGALAIVSGRSLPELETYLAGFDGPMVGSHGAESRGLGQEAVRPEGLADLQQAMEDFCAENGLLYEPKSLGGGLHYRAKPELQLLTERFAAELTTRFPGFEVQLAKMAVELRPGGVSKDRALEMLSHIAPFTGRRPVYAGDDVTDEPALAWAEAHGGFGVKVGDGATAASHRLAAPAQVRTWLAAALEDC
ncbi:trehalose 6-phosphatase [Rhodobacter aestuarii]|uniref:Trehalose 6-phosphate phosphatase n=1 Tax=Rhodobacter aestuarii TaxID=453582 RepID=A0A1N7Q8S3_9RHOB|nr:trehalose-phosphatase [Rhodobacter aestuarii]PTV93737.1 trehalose 6-phosphatase [Rhodobacter aestuarii]SIT19149.1 trehalose 6-phosphatase [Rhodobacter aestuarii]